MLSRRRILELLHLLNARLALTGDVGELYLVGGAVMCLAFRARPSTQDLDGYFAPKGLIRQLAAKIGAEQRVGAKWLNDAVKGYLSEHGAFASFLDLSNLKVFAATAEYLLAMKCLAMRLGPEFHDESDVRFLLRYLNLDSYDEAITVIARYYPIERFPQKTLYALEELLPGKGKRH